MDDNQLPPRATTRADTLMRRVGDWFYATRNHWKRGLLMLLYVLAFSLVKLMVTLIAVFQFGYILITGGPNRLVRDFGASLALFTGDLVAFLVCAEERPPFPFREWPRLSRPEL
jgi:Domain of unknown function (DUF4389)